MSGTPKWKPPCATFCAARARRWSACGSIISRPHEPWCRDHEADFLVRGPNERAIVDWDYNAWGDKYPPFDLDDAIPQHIAKLRGLPLFSPGIVMEGGSIEVNGRVTLLTSEACLLNPNRNPHLTKEQIEGYLRDYLGVSNVLWLGEGIEGDDTDGHIDDLTPVRRSHHGRYRRRGGSRPDPNHDR